MNKVAKHIGYFITGAFLLVFVHWVVTGAINFYKTRSFVGKFVLMTFVAFFVAFVWYASEQQAKADQAFHDNLYKGYDKFQDLNSKEIRDRAWRREHNCMTSEDFN